ncbi:MAG: ATP-dependent helicase [Massilia sp.]|nr:ATP-dependent helicase [Massilia sp.]
MSTPDVPRFVAKDIDPTEEQRAIQLSKSRIVVIEANAGAAKTTTLALRIGEALARGLDPVHILALTFTSEARDVLKRRLVDIGIAHSKVALLRIATFEEFARDALEKIELRKVPSITHIKDLKFYVDGALQNVFDKYGDRLEYLVTDTSNLALSQFFQAQLELKATMRLHAETDGLSDDEISDAFGMQFSSCLGVLEYENIRLGRDNLVLFRGTFDATYDLACTLDDDASARPLLPRYRIILCDELHDLNEAAFHLLQHLIEPQYSYFIGAGDRDQVIHSRLGASESFMRSRFGAQFPGAVATYPLSYSFRHGPHLAYAVAAFKNKPVDSLLTLHTAIEQIHYDDATAGNCAERVVQCLQQWKKSGRRLDQCTILIREPHHSIAIENALMHADIRYATLEMQRYLDREEILFLRGMIAIALDNFATTDKTKRGAVYDAVVTFAEVSFAGDDNAGQLRQAVIDEPVALTWLFSGRVDQRGAKDAADKVRTVIDRLHEARQREPADHVLTEMRQQLSNLHAFVGGEATHKADPTLTRALHEVDRQVTTMIDYLESKVLSTPAEQLLQTLRNELLVLLSFLDQLAAGDVKQRMAKVVAYMRELGPDTPAADVLRHICQLMRIEDIARRLYVHPHEARVVTKSIAGFIAAAEQMQLGLRAFSEWIAAADTYAKAKKDKHCVQLDCVRNAKGKEFEHVILPFLEIGEFPFERADPKEEDNLFYVAITRAISALTLISPKDPARRSPFIARMNIEASRARAQAALDRNAGLGSAARRTEFKASGDDWAQAKALGANWDYTRKVFYLKEGQDAAPFARWLG